MQGKPIRRIISFFTKFYIRYSSTISLNKNLLLSGTVGFLVEFEYSSILCSINYLDVQYSDPQMRKHVEENPNVLRNIDSHLRNNLLYQEYNIK